MLILKLILKKYYLQFQKLKPFRKISTIIFIIIIIATPIASILCTIAFLHFSQLISNISIPSGFIYLDLDIYSPETMTIEVPYEINNPGIYDLTEIRANIELRLNYINESNAANITSLVFSKNAVIGRCKAFHLLMGSVNGTFTDFYISPLVEFYNYADEFETVHYLLDIDFQANFFFRLITLQFSQENLDLLSF